MGTTTKQGYFGTPPIVTRGLVLHLDAGSRQSYVSGSTTWSDLSGNGYNGTLTNNPTASSINQGTIFFNGTNNYITSSATTLNLSTTSNFTYCSWIYPDFSSAGATGKAIIDFTGPSPIFLRSYLRWEGSSLGFYMDIADNTGGSAWRTNPVPAFSANTWHYICITHASDNTAQYYFDGQATPTALLASLARTVTNNSITIGYGAVNSYYWSGGISITKVYNRSLSAAEINQNYNALKNRFGLT
tara:strand:+ start:424 stop:1155 length:732 start_codon:yes stop_codon:yes gene_type:complete